MTPDPLAAVCAAESPCPICAGPLRARPDRKGRLYLRCSTCSLKLFAGGLTVDRTADLLAGFAVLASPEGRKAVSALRPRLGLPATQATTWPASAQEAVPAPQAAAEGGAR